MFNECTMLGDHGLEKGRAPGENRASTAKYPDRMCGFSRSARLIERWLLIVVAAALRFGPSVFARCIIQRFGSAFAFAFGVRVGVFPGERFEF